MKPSRLSVLITLCLIFFISFTWAANKEEMKLRLFKGDRYVYVVSQENKMQESPQKVMMDQKMALKIDHSVIDRMANGNFLVQATFKSFTLELNYNGITQRYQSDTVDVTNKYYPILNFLTDVKLTYEVSPEGKVSKITGFEPIKKKIETDSRLASLIRFFGNEQFIRELYQYIPAAHVEVGDQWIGEGVMPDLMNLKYDIQFTLKEVSAQNLKLDQKASIEFSTEAPTQDGKSKLLVETGTQKGNLLLDPATRLCLSSDIHQQMEISAPGQNKEDGDPMPPITLISRTKVVMVKK